MADAERLIAVALLAGRFIAVVFEVLNPSDPLVMRPITAYDVPEPGANP